MELTLERGDLTQVQATNRKTTRLLPLGKKRQQQIVVGDHTGSLLCFGMKRDQVEQAFKSPALDKECTRVELGGEKDGRDKIFMASSGTVRAFTRKGKEFLRFNTNLTEPIKSMWVGEEDIHTGGEFMYNQFINCKDTYFFISSDRINDLTCEELRAGNVHTECILACQDRMVRVIAGNELLYEAPMGGPVLTVEKYSNTHAGNGVSQPGGGFGAVGSPTTNAKLASQTSNDGRYHEILYGTENGMVGQLLMDSHEMRKGWVIDPILEGRRGKAGGVQCLAAHDLTRDGVKDILVGRDDGGVEVWAFDTGPQPQLVFERALQESITSVEGGLVSTPNFDEVIVTTYSGKIISFSSEPSSSSGMAEPGAVLVGTSGKKEKRERGEKKIRNLRDELDKLRVQVERERARHAATSNGNGAVGGGGVGTEVQFKMNDKWALSAEEARYELSVELSMPIDTILLQCDVPIELLDADSNGAIVSRTPTPSGLLATFRCQELVNRLEMCVRTSEGRYGSLQAYVWPRISPKMCQARSYPIKPLSLHTRVGVLEGELPELNALKISGSFSLAEVHSWVVACLPEVPARLPGDDASFIFRNTFLDTLLLCDYCKGEATFRSDSLTTLSIVKEVVTKEATARKIQIQIAVDPKESTVTSLLRKIDPILCYQLSLTNKVKLIDTLKEVKMQEPDTDFLAPEYVDILENEDKIKRELKEQPHRLHFLHGIIVDLYVDHAKFNGKNVTAQVPQLERVLQDYSIEALLGFFNRSG
jgi:Bardet-Biedl syndrome 7 protein